MSFGHLDLPDDVWTHILQEFTDEQWLCVCARVCQSLSRAAAATQSLELDFGWSRSTPERPWHHDAFQAWTSRHGNSLTRLDLSSKRCHSGIRELACPHLRELSLSQCSVQLSPGNESVGLLYSCTALTQLELQLPVLLDGVGGAAGAVPVPSTVAQLQHLKLLWPGQLERKTVQALEARVVPHLTSLTYLKAEGLESSFLTPHVSTCSPAAAGVGWHR
jgi:hypothetical protein